MLLVIAFLCFAVLFAAWIVTPTAPPAAKSTRTGALPMPEPGHMPA